MYRLLLLLFIFTSCKYHSLYNTFLELENAKINVELISHDNLTTNDHEIIKKYFGTIKNISYELKTNSYLRSYFHKVFFRYFKEDYCEKKLMEKDVYLKLLSKCYYNDLFVCSDSLKYYPTIIAVLKEQLNKYELETILGNNNCKQIFSNWRMLHD